MEKKQKLNCLLRDLTTFFGKTLLHFFMVFVAFLYKQFSLLKFFLLGCILFLYEVLMLCYLQLSFLIFILSNL